MVAGLSWLLLLTGVCSTCRADLAPTALDCRLVVDRVRVPEVRFEGASLEAVSSFLRERSRIHDPMGEGINVVVRVTDLTRRRIDERGVNLELDDVPLRDLIRYVCLVTGLRYRIDRPAVILADHTVRLDAIETRVFHVAPGVFDTGRTRARQTLDAFEDDED
jgi:hypothetical protein